MKFNLQDKTLTLFIKGEINSNTAPVVEDEINDVVTKQAFTSLVFDFEQVNYISSAGLRVILKFKQHFQDVKVINVHLEVYDVFQMTGFTDMMTIEKALNRIDVDGAEIIGEGFFSTVYRINKDTIIKVFKNEQIKIEEVKRELNLAKQAFVLGIPTAISFDVVRVGTRLGVRFEMLDSKSLRDLFRDNPDRFDELVQKYAHLLKTINTTTSIDDTLPNAKAAWLNKLNVVSQYLDQAHYEKLKKMLEAIPERKTFIHGDCHIKNIMSQDGELFLIDMDTLSKGHPIFELAAIYAPYVAFEEDDHGNTERFFGITSDLAHKIFDNALIYYFDNYEKVLYDKIAIVSYCHMMWWTLTFDKENQSRLFGNKDRLIKLLDQYDDLDIGI